MFNRFRQKITEKKTAQIHVQTDQLLDKMEKENGFKLSDEQRTEFHLILLDLIDKYGMNWYIKKKNREEMERQVHEWKNKHNLNMK